MTGRKIFGRILKGYIALALAFAFIFGICLYTGGYVHIKNEFEGTVAAELDNYAETLDTRLMALESAMKYISGDSFVRSYVVGGYNDGVGAEVQQALGRTCADFKTNAMTVYVSKLDSSLDKVIGTSQISGVYDFLINYQFAGNGSGIRDYFRKNDTDSLVKFYAQPSSGERGIIIIEENHVDEQIFYVIGHLNLNEISTSLISIGDTLTIVDGQNIVCNIGANTFDASNAMNAQIRDGGYVATDTRYIEDGVYIGAPSRVNNWTYIMSKKNGVVGSGAMMLLLYVLAICCVIFIAISVGAFFITKLVYRPINETVQFVSKYNDDDFFDEGVFVRQSIVKIKNERDAFSDRVTNADEKLKVKFVNDIICGLAKEEDIAKGMEKYSLSDTYGPYRTILIRFSDYELLEESFPKENLDKIKSQIAEFIDDQLKEQIVCCSVMLDRKTIALICYGSEVRQVRETLVDMAMMVQGSFDVEIMGAIGTDCDKLSELSVSYRSACDIMENRFTAGGRNAIVTEDDVRDVSGESFFYPLDVERELITSVVRARRDEVHRQLGEIFTENFENRKLSKDKVDGFVFAITATVNRVVEMLSKSADEIFGEGKMVFLDLKMSDGAEDLKSKTYGVFDTVMDYIEAVAQAQQDNLSDLLLEYIHSHYNEDISLLDIGGHFNLSQCYTSTIFKEATGENFKDYLSRYRIKMAKEILAKDPLIKNNELAKMIGCNTVATLFRLFNKYEGMSPGQYVKTLKL